jgi:general secretion pathway protein E/type IV pilus assembly protein PilB
VNRLLTKMAAAGSIDPEALDRAAELLAAGKAFEDAVVASGAASEEAVLRFLAAEHGLPFVELDQRSIDKDLLARFPTRLLVRHQLLPLEIQDGVVIAATSRLADDRGIEELRLASGLDLAPALAPTADIDRHLKRLLGVGADTLQTLVSDRAGEIQVLDASAEEELDLTSAEANASIIKLVNQILTEAIELRATDVHVEPFENQLRVRYRIDGILQEANIPAEVRRFQAAIVSRLKILSHLDIAEKRLPQDGRIRLKISGREIDVRVSIIPMLHGEAVVLRILDRGDALLGTEHLGMDAGDRAAFDKILDLPHGIVLVTGPTGSGKTTTLYAALSKINDIERKIITIEDPVEYQLRGINQIQVSAKTGLTFALGLRAILRHDPDVVLIGEIRDRETAEIAVQASLTGHLVFSTLHTNDAPGAATRLVDMGVEPYLVSSSLEFVIAQRLVRVICKECKERLPQRDADLLRSQLGPVVPPVLYRGSGCRRCQGTGFRGRTGIFEVMPVTVAIQDLIVAHAPANEIRKTAMAAGMQSLRTDGWRVVREGRTTPDEVLRATKEDAFRNIEADAPLGAPQLVPGGLD